MLHPVTEHIMAQKGVVARNMTRAVRNPTVVSELLEHETRVIVTKPAAARQRAVTGRSSSRLITISSRRPDGRWRRSHTRKLPSPIWRDSVETRSWKAG